MRRRLKDLRGPDDDGRDGRQASQSLAPAAEFRENGVTFSHFYNQARDAARCRPSLPTRETTASVVPRCTRYDRSGSQAAREDPMRMSRGPLRMKLNPRSEFRVAGKRHNIEKRAADFVRIPSLIENADCAAEIRLSHRKAVCEARPGCSLTWLDRVQDHGPTPETLAPLSKNASVWATRPPQVAATMRRIRFRFE